MTSSVSSSSASEVDDATTEMKIDEGMIDAAHLKGLMVSSKNPETTPTTEIRPTPYHDLLIHNWDNQRQGLTHL